MTSEEKFLEAFPAISDLYIQERWIELIGVCNSCSDEDLDPYIKNLLRFVCYIYLNNIHIGIGGLESLLVDFGNNIIVLKHLGVGYSLTDNKLLAKLYLEKAYGFSSGDLSISVLYAELLFRMGDTSQAESVYVDSIKRFPSDRQLIKGYVTLLYATENWVKLLDALDVAKFLLADEVHLFKEIDGKIRSKRLEWFKLGSYCCNCGELDCNSTYICKPYFSLHDIKIAPIQLEVFCHECNALTKGMSPIKSFSDAEVESIIDEFRISRLMQKASKIGSIVERAAHFMRCTFGMKDQFDSESERKIRVFNQVNSMLQCVRIVEYRNPVCLSCFSRKTTPIVADSTNRSVRFTNLLCPKCSARVFEKHKIDVYKNFSFPDTKQCLVFKLVKCNLDFSVIEVDEHAESLDKNKTNEFQDLPEIVEWDRRAINRF